jgi:hypothetical protein
MASGAALASDPGGVSLPPPQNRLCPHFTNKAAMAKPIQGGEKNQAYQRINKKRKTENQH